ncbi:MAG: quinol dehydrogenase ferredoxin subunit NapH [Gammaproteobacteria bacterium]|nr:quinol dehydrogenase ferredoxin subunit NapH [Gammaproteobacteria bacterium]
MANRIENVGAEAVAAKGWFMANKWLILRRVSQLSILGLFIISPFLVDVLDELWIAKGTLSSSVILGVVPLTDPYVLIQGMVSGDVKPEIVGLVGALIVIAFYLLVGGRVYCSWVCPVNMITDAAAWLRRKLGLKDKSHISRSTRYWMLGLTLILPLVAGGIVWELVNPVSLLYRGILFGMGTAWMALVGIFLFDLLISNDGWCGRICPVGAFYSLLAVKSPLRVVAGKRDECDDCMDCYMVCPEVQVIKPALKGAERGLGPVILSSECTNCGRCIDVCARDVFRFGSRFTNNQVEAMGVVSGHEDSAKA